MVAFSARPICRTPAASPIQTRQPQRFPRRPLTPHSLLKWVLRPAHPPYSKGAAMEFAFSDEQEMIRESAEGFLADVSDCAAVRAAMVTEQGYDSDLWQRLCSEMYWPAIHIPEAFGGLGLGFVELTILLEQMGRRLLCSPFFATACMATPALLLAGSEAQKNAWLPRIADGSVTATLAFTSGNGWSADDVQATAIAEGEGFVLNGMLSHVIDGHSAGPGRAGGLASIARRWNQSCAGAVLAARTGAST